MLEEKVKQLKELFGGTPEAVAVVDEVVNQVGMQQKELETAGIAYKDAPEWAQALITEMTTLKAEVAALKAPAAATDAAEPPSEEAPPAVAEETMDDGMGMDEESDITLSPGDLQAIGDAVGSAVSAALTSALQPLVGAMDMETKMAGHMNELKAMFGGYTKKKDDEAAQAAAQLTATQQEVAALKTSVDALAGDLPRGLADAYRATTDPWTGAPMALKGLPVEPPDDATPTPEQPFADIKRFVYGITPQQ